MVMKSDVRGDLKDDQLSFLNSCSKASMPDDDSSYTTQNKPCKRVI